MEVDPTPPPAAASSAPEVTMANGGIPPEASETIYIQNLNERVKLEVMKTSLRHLFKHYGPVLNVTAHKNLRLRGQAFVSLESKEAAAKAVKEVKGFPLYSKPMQLSFAKTRSDAVVEKFDADNMPKHLEERKIRKKKSRRNNPLAVRARAKKLAEKADGTAPSAAPKRTAMLMPDEYLPPNRVLFAQNLPVETITKEILQDLFGQYPNLIEVRTIPQKKDIAFVEYADEDSATKAKEMLHNYKIDGETKIKITYARK